MQTPGPTNRKRIEACTSGRASHEMQSPMSPGRCACRCDGYVGGKWLRNTRGGLPVSPRGLVSPRGGVRSRQKSAEGIVIRPTTDEGPNIERRRGPKSR
jgi:hypothetical protein